MNSSNSHPKDTHAVDLFWGGPHLWPKMRQKSPLDKVSGVYMLTIESEDGYLIYGVGITTRPVRQRFNEHRREMLAGKYTLFDLPSLQQGIRNELWHGLWAGYDSDERKAEFKNRQKELREVGQKQMETFRIFVAEVHDQRLQQRIEAAVMGILYKAPRPFCDLPDKGMQLAPRRNAELPITIINSSNSQLRFLPDEMAV